MQIRLHEVKDQVNISVILRADYIEQSNNVLVAIEFLKKHDFSKGALGICGVLERVERLLDSHHLSRLFVDSLPDNAVSAFAQFLEHLVLA